MYKHFIAAIILLFAFVSGPSLATAQQGVQDGTYNQAPASDNYGQTGGTTDNRDGGFDWRWLLPLLAVPLFFLLKKDTKEGDRSQYRDQRFSGTKGGEATRNRDEDTR